MAKYQLHLILLAAIIRLRCNCITTIDVFSKYTYNAIFIESGCYEGDGIVFALKAGYEKVYSVELSDELYFRCYEKFKDNPKVHVLHGSSGIKFRKILQEINSSATFWLDGHYSGGITAKGDTNTPLLQELEAIRNHHIKNHTIMIDDIRQLGTWDMDFITINSVMDHLLSINPAYQFVFEHGFIPDDVLVASIATFPSNLRNLSIEIYSDLLKENLKFYFSPLDLINKKTMLDYTGRFCKQNKLDILYSTCSKLLYEKCFINQLHQKMNSMKKQTVEL